MRRDVCWSCTLFRCRSLRVAGARCDTVVSGRVVCLVYARPPLLSQSPCAHSLYNSVLLFEPPHTLLMTMFFSLSLPHTHTHTPRMFSQQRHLLFSSGQEGTNLRLSVCRDTLCESYRGIVYLCMHTYAFPRFLPILFLRPLSLSLSLQKKKHNSFLSPQLKSKRTQHTSATSKKKEGATCMIAWAARTPTQKQATAEGLGGGQRKKQQNTEARRAADGSGVFGAWLASSHASAFCNVLRFPFVSLPASHRLPKLVGGYFFCLCFRVQHLPPPPLYLFMNTDRMAALSRVWDRQRV